MKRLSQRQAIAATVFVLFTQATAAQTVQNTTTRYQYDANGNVTQITDPLGHITNQSYDALNRLTQQLQPTPATGVSRPAIGYLYNSLDQLTGVTDPRSLPTAYSFDGFGNRITQTSPDTGTTLNTYDEAGNLKSSKDARGLTTNYSYDAANHLIRIDYANGVSTTFEYGSSTTTVPYAKGRLIKITDESGQTAFTYDPLGRVLSKTQTSNTATSKNFTVSYSYGSGNTTGKLVTLAYPSGNKFNLGYDAAGRIQSLTLTAGNGSITPLLTNIGYASFGPPFTWAWGNSTATAQNTYARSIDLDGRITSYPLGNALNNGVMRTLTYDAAGRITGISHTGLGTGANAPANFNQSYGFDNLDRLTNTISSAAGQSYQYDVTGNRTQVSYGGNTYANTIATNSNRLTAANGPAPAKMYSYDAAGNLLSDGMNSYTYSARGRMSSANAGGVLTQYFYNGLGQRTRKDNATVGTTHFVYDEAGHLIGEYDANGKAIQETVYLGDIPVAVLKPGSSAGETQVYYVYADHLNTPRVITRASDNQMVWRWDSADAFGMVPPNENPSGLGTFVYNLRFPGQYFDRETGLFYNWHRTYDPATGRYLQSDPIGLEGGINTYTYVSNNPLSYIDPEGLAAQTLPGERPRFEGADGGGGAFPAAAIAAAIAAAYGPRPSYTPAQEAQLDTEHDRYKKICEQPPPPGLDKCETAKWERDRAKQCMQERQNWDDKWWPGRHAKAIQQELNRMNKWEKIVQRECQCP